MPNTSIAKILGGIFAVLSPIAILATVFALTGNGPVPPAQRNICTSPDSQYYSIISTVNTSNVLDVKNGYLPNGAGVQLWNWVGGANQIWFFDPIGTFNVPTSSPKCKTDNGKGNNYGLDKYCWQWGVNCNSNGKLVMIRSLLNGKCLDSNNSTVPHMWDCQSWNTNQYWYFLTIGSGDIDDDVPPKNNFLIVQANGQCLNPLGVNNGSPQFLVNCTGIATSWYVSNKT